MKSSEDSARLPEDASPDARFGLFEVYGVELEYMIVDRETLAVCPLADEVLREAAGAYVADVERGPVSWSNELVNHVLELKTTTPAPSLADLPARFQAEVAYLNGRLAAHGAMLLPTGAHPLMDPDAETVLWPHDNAEIYRLYDRIFDCRGHGWSNLQSVHLNLPFRGDDEFARLHAAIRVLLPIIPALSASTPLLDGRLTGFLDSRLEVYRHNQRRIPSLTGRVIPEPVFSRTDYDARIFEPIRRDIAPHDPEGLLDPFFLNSRGAIARFDRSAIEIRIIDLQECPAADLAVLETVVAVLRRLTEETDASLAEQQAWETDDLAALFLEVVRLGESAPLPDNYRRLFGAAASVGTAGDLWRHLLVQVRDALTPEAARIVAHILDEGTLATRLLRRLGSSPTPEAIRAVYHELATCLQEGRSW